LTVRDSKFFKSRLVPLGPKTLQVLAEYAHRRGIVACPQDAEASFFVERNAKPVNIFTLENAFQRIRVHAGLQREGGVRCQPRLHDLRHTSAVHRLTSWYREGRDVQKLLPQLSAYMGHTHLAATQVYLPMTPELLHEASLRFERYAVVEASND
jgi:integrase/recombinase XerD